MARKPRKRLWRLKPTLPFAATTKCHKCGHTGDAKVEPFYADYEPVPFPAYYCQECAKDMGELVEGG